MNMTDTEDWLMPGVGSLTMWILNHRIAFFRLTFADYALSAVADEYYAYKWKEKDWWKCEEEGTNVYIQKTKEYFNVGNSSKIKSPRKCGNTITEIHGIWVGSRKLYIPIF